MRTLSVHLALVLASHGVAARLLHSIPEDTHAFPKFRVAFLNSLPILRETADQWFKSGIQGGELEFLEQYQKSSYSTPPDLKGIESGQFQEAFTVDDSATSDNFTLELMELGPKDSYVCLIPKALETTPSPLAEEQPDAELTPARSWALLEPLTGTCIYHRHGWFTYSYCHNREIRQFKELVSQTPRLAGSYVPEEDPEWEAYTLGRAPTQPAPGADLTVAEQNERAANLELAKNAGSRYLVQRWADGTLCDKTGKNREVEVQFHCSMTMTDSILFVKETKTCSYVLVINTPRLCGEPGFKSRDVTAGEALIRCREIVDTLPQEPLNLPITDYPLKGAPPRKPKLPSAPLSDDADDDVESGETGAGPKDNKKQERIVNELLRQTIEALMKKNMGGKAVKPGEPTEIVIELTDGEEHDQEVSDSLMEALRAAGYDVRGAEFLGVKGKSKEGSNQKKKNGDRDDGE